jgi:hypothetical protein
VAPRQERGVEPTPLKRTEQPESDSYVDAHLNELQARLDSVIQNINGKRCSMVDGLVQGTNFPSSME